MYPAFHSYGRILTSLRTAVRAGRGHSVAVFDRGMGNTGDMEEFDGPMVRVGDGWFNRLRWTLKPPTIFYAATLGFLLALGACSNNDAQARSAPDSFSPLVKKVLPSVVNIAVTETVNGGDVASEIPPELRDTPLGREFRRRFRG